MSESSLSSWSNPPLAEVEPWMNIPWLLKRRVEANPKQTVIETKTSLGNRWIPISAEEFWSHVNTVARGLIGMGLKPGDRFAIMSRCRYEWTLLDFAAWSAGLVVVPIYETDSAEQIEWIFVDSGPKVVVTETLSLRDLVASVAKDHPEVERVLCLETDAITEISLAGRYVAQAAVEDRQNALRMDDLATIIYTSGTTGRPKGVELTHSNFVSLSLNGYEWIGEVVSYKEMRLLLFLPLAHVFARFLEVICLGSNGVLGHTPDTKNLLTDLESFAPSLVLVVPRVLEKIYNSADAKAGSGFKLRMFRNGAQVAIAYSRALDTPQGPSFRLKLRRSFYNKLVYQKIVRLLGANARHVISGGAPLGERMGHFYRGIGVCILEGYGLTETTAPLAVNKPGKVKIGTIGPLISGLSARVDQAGELYVKGVSVFRAYHNDPENTATTLLDGWLATGDLASIDEDGYIRINGRKKEIIVTAGGKNVAPAALEDQLRSHPLISQVIVIGDRKPFVAALITLDDEMLPMWLRNRNLPNMDVFSAARHPAVRTAIEHAVQKVNETVSRAESIRQFEILNTDFTVENGMLTPSMKVRRTRVTAQYATLIDQIYGEAHIPDIADPQ